MDTSELMAAQLTQRAEALRVLAAMVKDEESRNAILQWAVDYEWLRGAFLNWGRSQGIVSEDQHRLHAQRPGRHSSETDQYRALIAGCQRLIGEMQAWQGVFEDECEFIKELERIMRGRFAQSRPSLRAL